MAQQSNKDEKEKLAPIVIKRIKKGGGGHHGGAWKVAYADFVTAMMAFFLLLWLLNVTTDEQKNAISNYFDPSHPKVSDVTSGAGGLLAGMSMAPVGAMVSTVQPIAQPDVPDTSTRGELSGNKDPQGDEPSEDQLAAELRKKEDARFNDAAEKLKAEIAASPDLKDLQKNLLIDITPEGMRIQIVDDQGRSMFPSGSAQMYDFMRQLLVKVTSVIVPLPNQVSVRGHTDSAQYRQPNSYDNWNLSADRAQASRRAMVQGGLPEKRIENVMGRADREHLDKEANSARNRRISIILLRERLTQANIEKLKSEMKGDAKKGVQPSFKIIDDTQDNKPQPAKPAPQGAQAGTQAGTPAGSGGNAQTTTQQQDRVPLPVTPGAGITIQRQPQVMVFGDAPQDDAPLYAGPEQAGSGLRNAPSAPMGRAGGTTKKTITLDGGAVTPLPTAPQGAVPLPVSPGTPQAAPVQAPVQVPVPAPAPTPGQSGSTELFF